MKGTDHEMGYADRTEARDLSAVKSTDHEMGSVQRVIFFCLVHLLRTRDLSAMEDTYMN